MQTKYKMPPDVRSAAIGMVQGYQRRVQLYRELRDQVIHGGPPPRDGVYTASSVISDPTVDKTVKLEELENLPEVKRMRAVEQAKLRIGVDIREDAVRRRLAEAIWDSCMGGRQFRFEYQGLDMGKSTFYERRNKFLSEIARDTDFL